VFVVCVCVCVFLCVYGVCVCMGCVCLWCVCLSIEALTTREAALRYTYDTYMCVCEYIYIYCYEALGSAATSMRP